MDMPILTPVPIKTKNRTFCTRFYRWITYVRKWRVVENWHYTLADGSVIVIPKNFVFDGASIPKPLWFLLSPTGLLLIPGLIHDFAYRYDYLWMVKNENGTTQYEKYQHNAGRYYWDKLFKTVGQNVNGMKIINTLASTALFMAGGCAWEKNRKRNAADISPDHR